MTNLLNLTGLRAYPNISGPIESVYLTLSLSITHTSRIHTLIPVTLPLSFTIASAQQLKHSFSLIHLFRYGFNVLVHLSWANIHALMISAQEV